MRKYKPGVKLNFLTILEIIKQPGSPVKALCRCDCGTEKLFYMSNIRPSVGTRRYTQSCGCKRGEIVSGKVKKHGLSKQKFYKHWRSMLNRTLPTYINANAYKHVTVYKPWRKFDNFLADMGDLYKEASIKYNGEKEVSLDRIDPWGGYYPDNCRWISNKEQSYNKKDSIFVTYKGETLPLRLMCDKHNASYTRVYSRLRARKYDIVKAMENEPWEGNRKVCG